jgi:hypothetical protein
MTNQTTTTSTKKELYSQKINDLAGTEHECVVCYETKPLNKVMMCENGHFQCGKCVLNRFKGIYQEGRYALHNDDAQKCFICRVGIDDDMIQQTMGRAYDDMRTCIIAKYGCIPVLMEIHNMSLEEIKRLLETPKEKREHKDFIRQVITSMGNSGR